MSITTILRQDSAGTWRATWPELAAQGLLTDIKRQNGRLAAAISVGDWGADPITATIDLMSLRDRWALSKRLADRGTTPQEGWQEAFEQLTDRLLTMLAIEDSEDRVVEPNDWEQPIFFTKYEAPDFPTEVLPPWLQNFVEAEASATQTPPDLAAMLTLAALSTACARKVTVHVKDGWREPVNLYVVVTLPSGERKTAVFVDVAMPIEEREREAAEEMAPKAAEAASKKKVAENRLQQLQSQAAKTADLNEAKALTEEAAGVAKELLTMDVPAIPRLIVDDCTPEKVASILKDQGGRIAVLSDEGDIFDLMAARYGNSPNFGVFLRGHSGDNLRVDRVGRPPEFVRGPAITMGLAVQPEVVRGLVKQPGFRGRGLLARFLYSWPKSIIGHREVDAQPVPEQVRYAYHAGVKALLTLPFNTDERGEPAPFVLRLEPQARALLRDFETWLEPQLAEFGELANMTDWAGKLAGAIARIAGLLHMAEHCHNKAPWQHPISGQTMTSAIRLAHYLISHAKVAFGEMGADGEAEDARRVLAWVERAGVTQFRKQEVWQGAKGYFKRAEALDRALTLLEERNYIRQQPMPERPGPGRKPAPSYDVNPKWLNCRNCRNCRTGIASSESEDSEDDDNCRNCRNCRIGLAGLDVDREPPDHCAFAGCTAEVYRYTEAGQPLCKEHWREVDTEELF